jgi:hypothetical protein
VDELVKDHPLGLAADQDAVDVQARLVVAVYRAVELIVVVHGGTLAVCRLAAWVSDGNIAKHAASQCLADVGVVALISIVHDRNWAEARLDILDQLGAETNCVLEDTTVKEEVSTPIVRITILLCLDKGVESVELSDVVRHGTVKLSVSFVGHGRKRKRMGAQED